MLDNVGKGATNKDKLAAHEAPDTPILVPQPQCLVGGAHTKAAKLLDFFPPLLLGLVHLAPLAAAAATTAAAALITADLIVGHLSLVCTLAVQLAADSESDSGRDFKL